MLRQLLELLRRHRGLLVQQQNYTDYYCGKLYSCCECDCCCSGKDPVPCPLIPVQIERISDLLLLYATQAHPTVLPLFSVLINFHCFSCYCYTSCPATRSSSPSCSCGTYEISICLRLGPLVLFFCCCYVILLSTLPFVVVLKTVLNKSIKSQALLLQLPFFAAFCPPYSLDFL